ncbi:hypothetical protein [Neisseria meningitidis]|uniref:hypothetical protein n=1 Tax=Neisseria meningitidis TaxID=487 RepID=UPI0016421EDF|nr:hypothetical protein [Neisseria meningitidis]
MNRFRTICTVCGFCLSFLLIRYIKNADHGFAPKDLNFSENEADEDIKTACFDTRMFERVAKQVMPVFKVEM